MEARSAQAMAAMAEAASAAGELGKRLQTLEASSSKVVPELLEGLRLHRSVQETIDLREKAQLEAVMALNAANHEMASLRQELAQLERRLQDANTEYERLESGPLRRKLRRERAKQKVQIEEKEGQLRAVAGRAKESRAQIQAIEGALREERLRAREAMLRLDEFQSALAPPRLYLEHFGHLASGANAAYILDRDLERWRTSLRRAVKPVEQLYGWLAEGRYRLDINHELVGGRTGLAVEAVYALAACGDRGASQKLFAQVADPEVAFFDVTEVFRLWLIGWYLEGERDLLQSLLNQNRYAEGRREHYVEAFQALVGNDPARLEQAARRIARGAERIWSPGYPGLGLMSLGAIAVGGLPPVGYPESTRDLDDWIQRVVLG